MGGVNFTVTCTQGWQLEQSFYKSLALFYYKIYYLSIFNKLKLIFDKLNYFRKHQTAMTTSFIEKMTNILG